VGKTSLCHRAVAQLSNLRYSISHTTRPRRPQEVDERDYFFISQDQFRQMKQQGDFLEWAEVHRNFYGTSRKFIEEVTSQGEDVTLAIDVQGAAQIRANTKNSVLVFVLPPSLEQLEQRLLNRASDTPETIRLRLENAYAEVNRYREYDYLLINDNLDQAVADLSSIIRAERCRR